MYFDYFCKLLYHFPVGIAKAKQLKKKNRHNDKVVPTHPVDRDFSKEEFLKAYDIKKHKAASYCKDFIKYLVTEKESLMNTLILESNKKRNENKLDLFSKRLERLNSSKGQSDTLVLTFGKCLTCFNTDSSCRNCALEESRQSKKVPCFALCASKNDS